MSAWLLLHGFTGAPAAFESIIASFPRQAVLAPALLGHGSLPPMTSSTFSDEVERLSSLISQRWGEPVHVLGYSMGARLALGLMEQHPNLVSSAILIGVNPGLASEVERKERRKQDAAWRSLLEQAGVEGFLDRWQALPMFDTQRQLPEPVLEAQRRLRLGHSKQGLCQALDVLGLAAMPNYWPQLPQLRQRVDLVVGGEDHKFRGIAESMTRELPHARLHVIPGVGHNVLLEAPSAVVALAQRHVGGNS